MAPYVKGILHYEAPEDLEKFVKDQPTKRVKRFGHLLKTHFFNGVRLVRKKALALRPQSVPYYSLWRTISRCSPVALLLVFVAAYVHVHPQRVEKADAVVHWTNKCSASVPSAHEPYYRWSANCSVGPIARPFYPEVLAATTACYVRVPLRGNTSGVSVNCQKDGEPSVVSTEPDLRDVMPPFIVLYLLTYLVCYFSYAMLDDYLCRLRQSATDNVRKNVSTCPMETIVSCHRTYPDASAELKLLSHLSDSLAKPASMIKLRTLDSSHE